jgi:hypothetical protein
MEHGHEAQNIETDPKKIKKRLIENLKRRRDTSYRTNVFNDFDRENEVYRKFNFNPRQFRAATMTGK